jgi:SAM-dependent methyltransferase
MLKSEDSPYQGSRGGNAVSVTESTGQAAAQDPGSEHPIELSIVMPCLNEAETLADCIVSAQAALEEHRIVGEIVVADNGSKDGSPEIAARLGARVVVVEQRGYGKAMMEGIAEARGRYVVMGDADGSYDFRGLLPFVEKLRNGYDLVQGCRLARGGGQVVRGAMPPLHRHVGNPLFSWIARRYFRAPISDLYCGLRAFPKAHYERLDQRCDGMEFAAEMIVKSSLASARIAEVPITLHRDGRKAHKGHLRTVRDGWRTLCYLVAAWRAAGRADGAPAAAAPTQLPVQFDTYASDYERALQMGLRYSGEKASYFARGRVLALAARLRQLGVQPRSVLDYGCGTGATMPLLKEALNATRTIGVDVSELSLAVGRTRHHGDDAYEFRSPSSSRIREADCVYCNGVFHHIPAVDRAAAIAQVRSALLADGLFAFCENNPWNPATRLVMRSIPFDRDAQPLGAGEARRLLRDGGFDVLSTDYLFVFPRALRMLRRLEGHLKRWPVGAQYMILARKSTRSRELRR